MRFKVEPLIALLVAESWFALLIVALVKPDPSTFYTYHMSFHEHWYPSVFRGEIRDEWLPPGFVWTAHLLPMDALQNLRVVAILSSVSLVAWIWKTHGEVPALLVASNPLLLVFGSRAQPDSFMLLLALGGMFLAHSGKPFRGGLFFGLSAFVKPVGLIAGLGVKPSLRWVLGAALGLLPFLWWFLGHQESVALHEGKSQPFEDLWRIIFVLPFVTLSLWLGFKAKPIWVWIVTVAFALFAFEKAPLAHEYYLLPAVLVTQLGLRTDNKWTELVIVGNVLVGLTGAVLLWRYAW